jgi:hypothetical protein
MEVLRGTIREVVGLLPDDAHIEAVVPVQYKMGSVEAIYDVVVVLPKPEVTELPSAPEDSKAERPAPRKTTQSRATRSTAGTSQRRRSTPRETA